MSKTVAFREHTTQPSGIPSLRNEKVDENVLLAELHRSIRLSNWQAIKPILEHPRYGMNTTSLLLRPNSIGWTALHFVALHGTPNNIWLSWIIQRAKEEYLRTLQLGKGIQNPFHSRTNAGHSPIDLYFAKSLHPFPWELDDVVRSAYRLRRTIGTILSLDSNHDVISEMKQKICDKMKEAQLRLKTYMDDKDIQSSIIWDRDICFLLPQYPIESSNNVQRDEVELEMAASQHFHESEDDEYLPWNEASHLSENDKTRFVDFWHQMEILVLITTRFTLLLDDFGYWLGRDDPFTSSSDRHWNILHALAWTGAPEEVAKVAIKLYPSQLHVRDKDGNLPLHVACLSHQTSSLADGTWNHNRHEKPYGDVSFSSCVPFMISQLLLVYPGAAKEENGTGSYPINIALMAGKTWNDGVSALFSAFPLAVMNLDVLTNLPSFLIAASVAKTQSNERRNKHILVNNSTSFEEEMRAKRFMNKRLGCTWGILPEESKRKALEHAKKESEIIKITTVYELLRRMPGSIYCFNSWR